MVDDTRDIAIKTQEQVKGLAEQVGKLTDLVTSLKDDMTERRGAEHVAKWVIGLGSGTVGGVAAKFGTVLLNLPAPK